MDESGVKNYMARAKKEKSSGGIVNAIVSWVQPKSKNGKWAIGDTVRSKSGRNAGVMVSNVETGVTRVLLNPSGKSEMFAAELKQGVHIMGRKKGEPLTQREKDRRGGYLERGRDSAMAHNAKHNPAAYEAAKQKQIARRKKPK